ncbi:MAG: low molecular weight protein-tyrosine-phosphatase [bacterium]|nr:low molecular weight protein-tyrosine-phosphatase [bacterium]
MIRVLFICHGNICRSPMCEFYFRDLVNKKGLGDMFEIASAATSPEEIGNPVHMGTRRMLAKAGISCEGKRSRQMTRKDGEDYDYLIGMDNWNLRNIKRSIDAKNWHKVHKLLEFTGSGMDVADPWYTGNFDETWKNTEEGCQALLEYVLREKEGKSK